MKVMNNKAFTMIEILAAVTILGIIMTVAIMSIGRILEKSKNEYYKNQKDNVILATQSFIQDNTDRLPKNIGQTVKIKLSDLISQKYLKDAIKDYDKKKCNMDSSYVEVTKISQKDYSYNVFLDCPAYKDKLENKTDKSPSISISFTGTSYNDAKVKFTIQGNDKLVSYNYVIYYRQNSSAKYIEAKNSGSIAVNEKSSVSFTEDIASYLPGDVKVQVSATNSYGKTKSANNSKNYLDVSAPKCIYSGNQYIEGATNHIPWLKATSRTVSVGCEDDDVGCVKDVYTQTFTNNGEYGEIVIADKNGNKTTCKVALYLDNNKPSCDVITGAGSSSNWTNGTRNITVGCKDKESGCTLNSFSHVFTASAGEVIKNDVITIKDNAGNTNTCTVGVYIDKKPPLCGTIKNQGSSTNWARTSRTISVECTDEESGCLQNIVNKTIKANMGQVITTDYIDIKDKVGNISSCKVGAYLDYKSPTCTPCNLTSWKMDSAKCSISCSDANSGCKENPVTVLFENSGTKSVTVYDKVGNSTSCQAHALVDTENPECVFKGYSKVTSNASKASFGCTDSESGCYADTFAGTAYYPTSQIVVYVRDKVGHKTKCSVAARYSR